MGENSVTLKRTFRALAGPVLAVLLSAAPAAGAAAQRRAGARADGDDATAAHGDRAALDDAAFAVHRHDRAARDEQVGVRGARALGRRGQRSRARERGAHDG